MSDIRARIPMKGTISSLNVGVATGMVLYEKIRQELYGQDRFPTNFNFTNSKTGEGLFYNTIDENAFNYAGKNKNKDKKILYRKNVFLGELFHCIVTFYVENKK